MTEQLAQPNLPWAPVYTISEPSQAKQTVHGIVYVWTEDRSLYANAGRSLLRIGDTRMPLWCHSLLNPFLMMTLLPTLKKTYPTLNPKHWATLMGTTSDEQQNAHLAEIIDLAQLDTANLQCKANTFIKGASHCKGLHIANELYRKAIGEDTQPMHALLRELLTYLLNREDFAESTEHCNLPTLALSAVEIAQLYHALILPIPRDLIRQCPDELTDSLECWNEISTLMREYATLLGGNNGLDSHLISAFNQQEPTIPFIAKADPSGLFCAGIGPNAKFADGLGFYIQLAPDHTPESSQVIVNALLNQLGLVPAFNPPVHIHFYFDLQSSALPS